LSYASGRSEPRNLEVYGFDLPLQDGRFSRPRPAL